MQNEESEEIDLSEETVEIEENAEGAVVVVAVDVEELIVQTDTALQASRMQLDTKCEYHIDALSQRLAEKGPPRMGR